MNRYRTVPGLGPSASKATSTTTCQKCLKKGHYSYECKASVQSRPYTSRPSRSQQMQNPKLKPVLAEQKMEVPKTTAGSISPSTMPQEVKLDVQLDEKKKINDGTSSRKRRRSASSSSSSSIATISTNASDVGARVPRSEGSKRRHHDTRSRSSSSARPESPLQPSDKDIDNRHDKSRRIGQSRPLGHPRSPGDHSISDSDDTRHSMNQHENGSGRGDDSKHRRELGRSAKRRRSQSADILPDTRRQTSISSKNARQRSLSPYSRRLALTQAMNADS